jgi:hypothetical protein
MGKHIFRIGFRDATGYRNGLFDLLQVLVDAHQPVHGIGEARVSGQAQLIFGNRALLLAGRK